MRTFKLIAFGMLGALGLLRGIELLFLGGSLAGAVIPLALGLAFLAVFMKTWKEKPDEE